jgi:hypothetical protein
MELGGAILRMVHEIPTKQNFPFDLRVAMNRSGHKIRKIWEYSDGKRDLPNSKRKKG